MTTIFQAIQRARDELVEAERLAAAAAHTTCRSCGYVTTAEAPESKGEPTQADALRAAARLIELVGDLARLSVRYDHIEKLRANPSYGTPSLDNLATLRALADRLGVPLVDRYANDGDDRYVRPEIRVTVDGVVIPVGFQVCVEDNPDVAAQARAWVAEAAS